MVRWLTAAPCGRVPTPTTRRRPSVSVMPRVDRIRYEELAEDLRKHYETGGSRSLKEARARFDHLKAFFHGPSRRIARPGRRDCLCPTTAGRAGRQRHDQIASLPR